MLLGAGNLCATRRFPSRGSSALMAARRDELASRMRTLLLGFFLCALGLLVGCVGVPSPLAPGLSGSIGLPHQGVLTSGESLPDRGPGYRLFRNTSARWGTRRLVAAIKHAAAEVSKRRPGAALLVGDLSSRQGGPRNGHRSHRTGRDVDLLLYCTTPDGRSVLSPGFVRYGADGLGETDDHKFVRFDVARSYELVRALVSSPEADVEWIFLARPLEALLIEYARAKEQDLELLWRMENVLLQPRDSAPHDDHMHLRIACTPEEVVKGCAGRGPAWPWLPPQLELGAVTDEELLAAMLEGLTPWVAASVP